MIRVVGLREAPALLAVSAQADIIENCLAQRLPTFEIAFEIELLDRLHRAIHRDPRHHFGMGEVPARATDFPDSLVWLVPMLFDEIDEMPLQVPGIRARSNADAAREMHRVHDFTIHIELKLTRGGVADAHRTRALVSR